MQMLHGIVTLWESTELASVDRGRLCDHPRQSRKKASPSVSTTRRNPNEPEYLVKALQASLARENNTFVYDWMSNGF